MSQKATMMAVMNWMSMHYLGSSSESGERVDCFKFTLKELEKISKGEWRNEDKVWR
jgi:hypothetical protein